MSFGFISFPYFSGFIVVIIIIISFSCSNHAALFEIQNSCPYTIWAAANPGGGRELHQGQTWVVNTDPNFNERGQTWVVNTDPNFNERGRIWARTNCNFSLATGKCDSGDCDGTLYCVTNGSPPHTLAEYQFDSVSKLDFFDISLLNGFNVPIEFKGNSSVCTQQIKCTGDINGLCPTELRHPGGCNHPCTVFKNDQFCCFSAAGPGTCTPTAYSMFFKDLCPGAYSYLTDDRTSLFTCPTGSNYKVVFCP